MRKAVLFALTEIEEEYDVSIADESFKRVMKLMDKHRDLFEKVPVYMLMHTTYEDYEFTVEVQLLGMYGLDSFIIKGNPYYQYDSSIMLSFTEYDLPDFHWISTTVKEDYPPGEYTDVLCIEPAMDTIYELYVDKKYVDNQFMKSRLIKEVD